MKKILNIALVLSLVVSFVGCGNNTAVTTSSENGANASTASSAETSTDSSTKQASEITLGISVDQQFESRVGVVDAAKAKAEELGIKYEEVVADGDAQNQNAQIESLINKHVDAILVCAVDQNTIETALLKAKQAKIPVVAYDRDLPDSKAVDTYVGPDSISDGIEAGKCMVEALNAQADGSEKIQVLELLGALNDQNGIDRSKGWNEELGKLENVEVIQMPTNWDSQTALEATQNAFQANPDIKAVFCSTDTFVPVVETVLIDLGKTAKAGEDGHIAVTGINGSKDGYESTVKGVCDGFVVMDLKTTGETAVQLAMNLINGEEVKRTNVIAGNLYTPENAEANKDIIWGAAE